MKPVTTLFASEALAVAFLPRLMTASALSMPFATNRFFPLGERQRPFGESPK